MKHHFGDHLDRSLGHWEMTPNADRFNFHFKDLDEAERSIEVLTITKWDANWKKVNEFQNLIELTIHEANQEMLGFEYSIHSVRRLRITHARPKTLEILRCFPNVEELVLEYVSSVKDLSHLKYLEKLKALHIENVRSVRDFSGIGGVPTLEYLYLDGTFDWSQPVNDLDFLRKLKKLEFLKTENIKLLCEPPSFDPLKYLTSLKKVDICVYRIALEDCAYIEANFSNIPGCIFEPYSISPAERRYFDPVDISSKSSLDDLRQSGYDVQEDEFGRVYEDHPEYTFFLGKGGKTLRGNSPKVLKRRDEFAKRYRAMVEKFRNEIQP